MKKLIKTLLILAIIAVAMMFTRPEREKHVEKLTSEIVKSSQEKHDNEDTGILQDLGNALLDTVCLWFLVGWRATRQFSLARLKPIWNYGPKSLA